jgi:hypothetical protein
MPTPEEEAAAKATAEKAAKETEAAAEKARADEAAKAALGDAGKAALDAERKGRKEAERAAREAQAKLDEIEKASLSETERLKKEAEEGKALAASATDKLRRANLMAALSEAGVGNVKAAVRLLDGVEYSDDDEPKNLDAAMTAAKAEFGEAMFKGSKPTAANIDGGGGGGDRDRAPSLTAEELAIAKSFDMTPEEYAAEKDPGYNPDPVKT